MKRPVEEENRENDNDVDPGHPDTHPALLEIKTYWSWDEIWVFWKQYILEKEITSESKINSDIAWLRVSLGLHTVAWFKGVTFSIFNFKRHLLWGLALHLKVLEVEEPEPVAGNCGQAEKKVKFLERKKGKPEIPEDEEEG